MLGRDDHGSAGEAALGAFRRDPDQARSPCGRGRALPVVDASGAKRWLFLFRWGGKLKEMGLGGARSVSLPEAREKAAEARREVGPR